jgi:hypothetical protein
VGQTRQELPGRSGDVIGVRCTCCGEPIAGVMVVTAVLREIRYEYCDEACRDRHAGAVALQPAGCGLCDLDAVGDAGRCSAHLDDDASPGQGRYPLAS